MLTDSKSLFDLITKGSCMSEKRLTIYIKETKEAYDQDVINEIGWIWREHTIADELTKVKIN